LKNWRYLHSLGLLSFLQIAYFLVSLWYNRCQCSVCCLYRLVVGLHRVGLCRVGLGRVGQLCINNRRVNREQG